jgi:hypothetical protein
MIFLFHFKFLKFIFLEEGGKISSLIVCFDWTVFYLFEEFNFGEYFTNQKIKKKTTTNAQGRNKKKILGSSKAQPLSVQLKKLESEEEKKVESSEEESSVEPKKAMKKVESEVV